MARYLKKQYKLIFFEIIFSLVDATLRVCLSFQMGVMTNAAVESRERILIISAILCVLCLALSYFANITTVFFRKRVTGACVKELKKDLYESLSGNGVTAFHKETDSYYMNLIQNDTDTLERDYFDSSLRVINLITQVLFCAGALFYVNSVLFFAFTIISFGANIVSRRFKRVMQKYKALFSSQSEQCIKNSKEFISGYDTIHFFSQQRLFIDKLVGADNMLENQRMKRDVSNAFATNGAYIINMIASIICMAVAAYLVSMGRIRIGTLTTSTQLLNFMFMPLNTAIALWLTMKSTEPLQEKIKNSLEILPRGEKSIRSSLKIEMRNVAVGYDGEPLIKDFSCTFEEGKKYAIIGTSGIGKSTLARLLVADAPLLSGSVSIDGVEVADILPSDLHKKVLYVPQKVFLFDGTVIDNIGFMNHGSRAKEIAGRTQLSDELFEQNVGSEQGIHLSGGEQIRLQVARALMSDAAVLIFDEPTSGLDPNTAKSIEELIVGIKNKTVIVITHNWDPNYLRAFDEVVRL
ncbi:MAG: ABC transporter ATP-binding protein/permease [Lachnospiraceae bacterium]|nr:ABC transporter ATP-binding protein/permease [Lachnospiraceae bacterium]